MKKAAKQKYEIVRENTMERDGCTLFQIRACKTFSLELGGSIKKGTLGGYVAGEKNLSQEGSCWIFDTCAAYENAQIKDDSSIAEYTFIHGDAILRDSSFVQDYVDMAGNVEVSGSVIFKGYYGAVSISGNIRISGDMYSMIINDALTGDYESSNIGATSGVTVAKCGVTVAKCGVKSGVM